MSTALVARVDPSNVELPDRASRPSCARTSPGSARGRRPSSRSASRSCIPTRTPSRSSIQARFWSSGTLNSGYIAEIRLGLDGALEDALESLVRVLVDPAEPRRVRDGDDAGDARDLVLVARRERLDDRRLVRGEQAIGARDARRRR